MNPRRWKPSQDSTGKMKAIMVVPDLMDEDGTVKTYKVWPNASPERDGHAMVWQAETLRLFYEPEKDGA